MKIGQFAIWVKGLETMKGGALIPKTIASKLLDNQQ